MLIYEFLEMNSYECPLTIFIHKNYFFKNKIIWDKLILRDFLFDMRYAVIKQLLLFTHFKSSCNTFHNTFLYKKLLLYQPVMNS